MLYVLIYSWDTYVDVFSNYECHNVKTITDETYIKALTGN